MQPCQRVRPLPHWLKLRDQHHTESDQRSLSDSCIGWTLNSVITTVREQTMWIRRSRSQEEQPQLQVQVEWTLVDGQLQCQWQPPAVFAEVDPPLSVPKRPKAA